MGKTKTAILSETPKDQVSGEDKYKQKLAKKEAKKAAIKGVGLKGGQRVNAVEGSPVLEESQETQTTKIIKKRGKKITSLKSRVDKNKLYTLPEAVKFVKETSYARFDATVELHAKVKKDDLNTSANLPHSFGKAKKIELADESTIEKLAKGIVDFDVLISTADMMPKLVPFAKLLGPKGLMPNPKTGTVVKDANSAKKFSADKLTIKCEKKAPLLHLGVGKVSQDDQKLVENLETVLNAINPKLIVSAYLTSTMGPSVRLRI